MRNLLIGLLLFLVQCSPSPEQPLKARDMIPTDASRLIRIRNINAFKTALANNPDLHTWLPQEAVVTEALYLMDHLNAEGEAFLALDSLSFILITDGQDSLLPPPANYIAESIKDGSLEYAELQIDSLKFFGLADSLYNAYSNSLTRIKNLLNEAKEEKDPWTSLLQASNEEHLLSLLRKKDAPPFPRPVNIDLPFSQSVIDLHVEPGYIKAFGIGPDQDSTSILHLFNTSPLPLQSTTLMPATATEVWSYGMNSMENLWKNKTGSEADSLLNDLFEIGRASSPKGNFLMLHSYMPEETMQFLEGRSIFLETYQEKSIREMTTPGLLQEWLNILGEIPDLTVFTRVEQAVIFATSPDALKDLLSQLGLQRTYHTSPAYQTVSRSLADASHYIHLKNIAAKGRETDRVQALQLVKDQGSIHSTYYEGLVTGDPEEAGTRKFMELQLDTLPHIPPRFVRNHYTGKLEIVIQDLNSQLYRISSSGQVLWKKQLDGFINGKIHEVDLYHNNKWQLAFTAGNRFLILDRNGKVVKPFDMDYPSASTMNPLAVFDYDNDKDYRFLVTHDKEVFMYNRKGQKVKGFTFTESDQALSTAPVHLRMEKRDYLVFQLEGGGLKILNRIGRERVPVSQSFDFGSPLFANRNQFVFTGKDGALYKIDRHGKVTKDNLGLEPDHGFTATPVRLVLLNGNELQIGDVSTKLEFGIYTNPQTFYIKNRVYVALTDLQSHQTYLFDSKGALLPGFPVHGNSPVDLADMDGNGSLELVVNGTDRNMLIYTLNP